MAHQGAATNFAIGFYNVQGQHEPHISRRTEALTKEPVVIGLIGRRVNKDNPLVPAELAQVADSSSVSRQIGLSDHPIKVVHSEGTV